MVHGVLTNKRESLIHSLIETHEKFCIKGICKDYLIYDYKGIIEFLTLFATELDNAENKILKLKKT